MSHNTRPVGLVVALNADRVIGRGGRIPWHRPADLRRFKRLTVGGTVVMGRRTFESIGRPLPDRDNVVVTRHSGWPGIIRVPSLAEGLRHGRGPAWVIGGAELYAEALEGPAHFVDVTHVPDQVEVRGSVRFPFLDPERWVAGGLHRNDEDPQLWHQRYERRDALPSVGLA